MTIRVKIYALGVMSNDLDLKSLKNIKSKIFQITSIETGSLRGNSDLGNWGFSDEKIKTFLPNLDDADLCFIILNVPLEDDWYTRPLSNKVVSITTNQIVEILHNKNLRLNNLILRVIYAYLLIFITNSNSIPTILNFSNYVHDETRGCLFDMTGIKEEIVAACDKPIICEECTEKLRLSHKISEEVLFQAKKEIKNIKKDIFYVLLYGFRKNPILYIFITWIISLLTNILATIITNCFK